MSISENMVQNGRLRVFEECIVSFSPLKACVRCVQLAANSNSVPIQWD
jgi:hypothetical protein